VPHPENNIMTAAAAAQTGPMEKATIHANRRPEGKERRLS